MNFLKHSIKWLCPGGILVFIVPEPITSDNRARIGQDFHQTQEGRPLTITDP